MKIILLGLLGMTLAFGAGTYYGVKTINNEYLRIINQLDAENQNLQYQVKQCIILYRGQ